MTIQLIQGDCIEKMAGIPDSSIDLVLTDPPYGMTACKWDTVIPFEPMWEQLKRITKKNGAICLFGSQPFTSALVMSNVKMFKYEWVWDKIRGSGHLQAKKRPMMSSENISVFCQTTPFYNPQMRDREKPRVSKNKGNTDVYNGDGEVFISEELKQRYPVNIVTFSKSSQSDMTAHPTQKPVALMEYLIKTYTNEGETVLDFTMGSGTTGVACKKLNRSFIGIELDEKYYEIAKKRIQEHK